MTIKQAMEDVQKLFRVDSAASWLPKHCKWIKDWIVARTAIREKETTKTIRDQLGLKIIVKGNFNKLLQNIIFKDSQTDL